MAKRIRHSLISLFLLQGGQYLASLILLPIFTQRLGVQGYGEMAFCLALAAYFGLLVEWGYGATSTKEVAIYKDDVKKRSEIFWNTFSGKLFLMSVAAIFLLLLTDIAPDFLLNKHLLWLAFGMVVANGLAPNFYYQGLEKLDLLFSINVAFRFLSIPVVLLFVHDAGDVDVAQGIVSAMVILAALANLYCLKRLQLIRWVAPSISNIVEGMKAAAPLFFSMAAIGLFGNSLTVILGYTLGATAVGMFAAALNLYKAAQGLFAPLSQILFPRFSHLFHHDYDEGVRMLKRVLLFQIPLSIVVAALLAWSASSVLPLLIGHKFAASVYLFQLMCVVLVLNSISNLVGSQLMVVLNHHMFFTKTVIWAGAISLLVAALTNLAFGEAGSVYAMIAFETIVIGMSVYGLRILNPEIIQSLKS